MDELTPEENKYFETEGQEAPETSPTEETPEEPKQEQKMVPLAALHEERMSRKELQQELEGLKSQFSDFESLKQEIANLKSQKSPQDELDPFETLEQETSTLKSELEELRYQSQKQQQAQESQAQIQQLVGRYQTDASKFAQENNDFTSAYNFVVSARQKEYMAMGYSEQDAMQFVTQDELGIVQKAYEDGVNPAERLYEIAKIRGYSNSDLETVAKGLDSQSNISKSNSQTEGDSTLEKLLSLEGSEFDNEWNRLFPN